MSDLSQRKCVPCEGGSVPLSISDVKAHLQKISGWATTTDFKKISKEFKFKTFVDSIQFVNEAARIAEEEGHHPDLSIRYTKVLVELSTHAIDGLSQNDFILAAKIDDIRL